MSLSKAKIALSLSYCLVIALISCRRGPEEVSSDIQPKQDQISAFFTDTLAVHLSTVLYDSVSGNTSKRALVGAYVDPIFGTIKATSFIELRPQIFTEKTLGPNPIIDEVKLYISTGTTAGVGSSYKNSLLNGSPYAYSNDQEISFSVHTVLGNIGIDRPYNYTTYQPVDYDPLNELGTITRIAGSNRDSTLLPLWIGQMFVDSVKMLNNPTKYYSLFNGLALVPKSNAKSIVRLDNIVLRIRFHNFYGINNIRKDESLDLFYENEGSSNLGVVTNLEVDRANSTLKNLTKTYDVLANNEDSIAYIQAYTGVCTKLWLPSLQAFVNAHRGKILVNKAELFVLPDLADSVYAPPSYLFMYELNEDGSVAQRNGAPKTVQAEEIVNNSGTSGIFGTGRTLFSSYGAASNYYRFTLTTYVQALIDGTKPNNGLLLAANNNFQSYTSGSSIVSFNVAEVNRMVIKQSKSKKGVYLRLHYSVIR